MTSTQRLACVVSGVEVCTDNSKISHVYETVEVRVTGRCSNQHQANVTCVIVDRCQSQIRCDLYAVNGVELTITRAGCSTDLRCATRSFL